MIPPLPSPLPDDVLARRKTLPLKPEAVTLEGQFVRLVPLDLERDAAELHTISNGQPIQIGDRQVETYDSEEIIWRYMNGGPFTDVEGMRAYLKGQVDAANGLPFCIYHQATGRAIGVLNYMSNMPEHLKIELGSIWYTPAVQRTPANTEATYLTLKHAFEVWGYRRLEWKCNALNERSRQAALRMGFKFEGIQEAHFIIKDRNRDTAWFRILDTEWADVKAQLEQKLYSR